MAATTTTDSTTTEKPTPGVLIVSSGILPTAKETLSPEIFRRWYEQIHIPDILSTGVEVAYRFSATSTSTTSNSTTSSNSNSNSASTNNDGNNLKPPLDTRPFLAIYPLPDHSFVASDDSPAWKIPVTSEILPNPPSKNIFELAEFQMGVFEKVIQLGSGSNPDGLSSNPVPAQQEGGRTKFIAIVGIPEEEINSAQAGSDIEASLCNSIFIAPERDLEGDGDKVSIRTTAPKRSTLFWWVDYSPPGMPPSKGFELAGYRGYLGVHEYDQLPEGKLVGQNGAEVYVFSALSSFGDVTKSW